MSQRKYGYLSAAGLKAPTRPTTSQRGAHQMAPKSRLANARLMQSAAKQYKPAPLYKVSYNRRVMDHYNRVETEKKVQDKVTRLRMQSLRTLPNYVPPIREPLFPQRDTAMKPSRSERQLKGNLSNGIFKDLNFKSRAALEILNRDI